MTEGFLNADTADWQSALAEFKLAEIDFKALRDHRDAAIDVTPTLMRYDNAKRALLCLVAPDLNAVAEKLMIIFDDELWEYPVDALQKCMVIGDLRRLYGLSIGWDGGED